jgi:hypothetical protein
MLYHFSQQAVNITETLATIYQWTQHNIQDTLNVYISYAFLMCPLHANHLLFITLTILHTEHEWWYLQI